jgi:cation diffusion facilitator CzcD-associated flavoprotein CzcO
MVRNLMIKLAQRQLRGQSDVANFTPHYKPWDERLCVVPNGDLFRSVRSGKADIVTDEIDRFISTGLKLASGAELEADIIITATGLNVQMMGGAEIEVDGEPVELSKRVAYKSVMLDGVPNAILVFGYTNASWTLKADLACEYACRLLNHMDRHGHRQAVPVATDADRGDQSVLGALSSGYVKRAEALLPRQGTNGPWRVRQDYLRDVPILRFGSIDDGVLQFSSKPVSTEKARAEATA